MYSFWKHPFPACTFKVNSVGIHSSVNSKESFVHRDFQVKVQESRSLGKVLIWVGPNSPWFWWLDTGNGPNSQGSSFWFGGAAWMICRLKNLVETHSVPCTMNDLIRCFLHMYWRSVFKMVFQRWKVKVVWTFQFGPYGQVEPFIGHIAFSLVGYFQLPLSVYLPHISNLAILVVYVFTLVSPETVDSSKQSRLGSILHLPEESLEPSWMAWAVFSCTTRNLQYLLRLQDNLSYLTHAISSARISARGLGGSNCRLAQYSYTLWFVSYSFSQSKDLFVLSMPTPESGLASTVDPLQISWFSWSIYKK